MFSIKNYLFSIILILVFVFGTNSQLSPSENIEAKKILTQIGVDPTSPCFSGYFSCNNYGSYQSVVQIYLQTNPSLITKYINADFSVFTNVRNIIFARNLISPPDFFQKIQNLTQLYSIYIENKIENLDSNIEFPKSLTSLQLLYYSGDFQTKWLSKEFQGLYITDGDNFSLTGDLSLITDGMLTYLQLPISKSPMPNLSDAFPRLSTIRFNMKNITYGDDSSLLIPSSYFGINFTSEYLQTLEFYKTDSPNQPSQFFQLPDFSNLPNLIGLTISADYFAIPNGGSIDFSKKVKGDQFYYFYLVINDNKNLFKNCNGCLKFGEKTGFNLLNVTVNLESTDFSSVTSLSFDGVIPSQKFIGKNFNYEKAEKFSIQYSNFYGDIPESICSMRYNYVSIHNNLFNGTIPSCYLCTLPDSEERDSILPNQFIGFDYGTPFNCENFELDILKPLYTINTNGGAINITGRYLGIGVQSIIPDNIIDDYYFSVPNEIFTLELDRGNGPSLNNFTVIFVNGQNATIVYTYKSPKIFSYSTKYITYFYGEGFDFINSDNIININGVNKSVSGRGFDQGYQSSYLYFQNNPLQDLTNGQSFDVFVICAGQVSETVTFIYISEDISILNDEISKLNSTGSTVTVEGSFYTSSVSDVKVLVGDVLCTVGEVSNSSLTYTYPGSDKFFSLTNLEITVSGKLYRGYVNIDKITLPKPSPSESSTPSPTPTAPSTTTTSTSLPTDSQSEEVSSSIKLKISYSLILIILVSLLF